MQNEFEKQVQQKMEELDLVPSPPVWQNIEKQIRKDKDRRRAIFWIPLGIVLLTGAAAWFWNSEKNVTGNNETVTITKNDQENKNQPDHSPGNSLGTFRDKDLTTGNNALSKESNAPASLPAPINEGSETEIASTNQLSSVIPPGKASRWQQDHVNTFPVQQLNVDTKKAVEIKPGILVQPGAETNVINKNEEANKSKAIVSGNELNDDSKEKSSIPQIIPSTDSVKKKDSVLKDVVVAENKELPIEVNTRSNAWQIGVLAGIGFSGEGNGIRLGDQKSMEFLSSGGSQSAPPPNFAGSASPINKGLSFTLGMSARKPISRNLFIITGLGLHYYSSSRLVGKQMQDSTLLTGDFVPNYYTNTGTDVNEVSSKYFFISLPVMLDWKFIPGKPLHVQAGLSVQHLLSSNAIQYDQANKIYYKDASSINKTQLFTNVMFGYEFQFKNKNAFLLGPSLQYGIRKLNEKENKHLFFAGINAQYFFR